MITKRDWRRFVQKVYKIDVTLAGDYHLTISGEKVVSVDIENNEIRCLVKSPQHQWINGVWTVKEMGTHRVYRHPDSFTNYTTMKKVSDNIRLEMTISGIHNIAKIIKTR